MSDAAVLTESDASWFALEDASFEGFGGAGASDASPADAASVDASASDAGLATFDCQLTAFGIARGYQTGEIGSLSGTHLFSSSQTGLCTAPTGCSVASDDPVVQASCDVSPCQMWESKEAGGGWYFLRNLRNGLCMYMADANDGTAPVGWECYTADQMLWQVACAGNDTWYLINKYSGQVLANDGAAGIVQSAQTGAPGQGWTIVSNASAFDVLMPTAEDAAGPAWRYTTSGPGSSWTQPGFDDSTWSTGPAAFGDQRRSFTPLGTAWTTPDIWLRRTFFLSEVPGNLTLKAFHDEGAEVYINGVNAASLTAWSNGYEAIDASAAVLNALVAGTNTVAVHCQNSKAPQFIDVGLVTYTWR